jgi:small-conductance mechanosensitive channel
MDGLRNLVSAMAERLAWAPPWLISLIILVTAGALAIAAHSALVAMVRIVLRRHEDFWRSLVQRTRAPGRLAMLTVFLGVGVSIAPLSPDQADLARRVLLFVFILLLGWIGITALDIAAALYLRGFRLDVEDNLIARKHLTQVRILRRAAAALIGVIALAAALMTVPGVKQYGVSLLASAGAAGIIIGLALQPILANLIAGVQIAMTQPIRLDDAVIVEGEWGNVEEITSTYVVVRLWDWRRMVLPLSWFLSNPFQNWTRDSARLIGSAFLYVDYEAPVDRLREALDRIVRASSNWDGDVINLQVTDITDRTLQIRCLASARNAGAAFDLRCEIREQLSAFIRDHLPEALPRDRLAVDRDPTSAAEGSPSRKTAENHPSG